ncbi:hypothetical protein HYW76_01905 [Candidatus Pacearchaeota archaeon]|nr:hypothetical protein [Candidatus Pacearchaeota archaeon]
METEIDMPYSADIKTAFAMVEVVGREHNISRPELYKHLPSATDATKSYSKKMADFLGLIATNGYNIEISETGKLFLANKGEENKKKFLANNLPKKYKMLLSWINNSNEGIMSLNELKQAIIKNKLEEKKNTDIYDWMLGQFAKYAEYLGIINYVKGQNSRCEITDFGKQVLSVNQKAETMETQTLQQDKPKQIFYADIALEGEYPIRILTRDGKPFDWDIHTEQDWVLVEQALKAIKARWEKQQNDSK